MPKESGLYYLQARYYDPTTGRFINADAFATTGQGILGNNMFAYCNNSPVVYADPNGYALVRVCISDEHDPSLGMFFGSGGGGCGGFSAGYGLSVASQIANTVREIEDIVNNTDAAVTRADLATNGYGFFRGKLVIKLDIMETVGSTGNIETAAFSFGVIFTGPKPTDNLLAHEYGHTVHLKQIGIVNYATKVAMPSVISFWLYPQNPYYESQPWEYIAEHFGKTTPPSKGYLNFADELALLYWIYSIHP